MNVMKGVGFFFPHSTVFSVNIQVKYFLISFHLMSLCNCLWKCLPVVYHPEYKYIACFSMLKQVLKCQTFMQKTYFDCLISNFSKQLFYQFT